MTLSTYYTRQRWEPGNSTSYELLLIAPIDNTHAVIVWENATNAGGGRSVTFARDEEVDADLISVMAGPADAAAILGWLSTQGITVVMPPGYTARGVWARGQSGGAA